MQNKIYNFSKILILVSIFTIIGLCAGQGNNENSFNIFLTDDEVEDCERRNINVRFYIKKVMEKLDLKQKYPNISLQKLGHNQIHYKMVKLKKNSLNNTSPQLPIRLDIDSDTDKFQIIMMGGRNRVEFLDPQNRSFYNFSTIQWQDLGIISVLQPEPGKWAINVNHLNDDQFLNISTIKYMSMKNENITRNNNVRGRIYVMPKRGIQTISGNIGENFTLTCHDNETESLKLIMWEKNDKFIGNQNSHQIESLDFSSIGTYRCVAVDFSNKIYYSKFPVKIKDPKIIMEEITNKTIQTNDTFQFRCHFTGYPFEMIIVKKGRSIISSIDVKDKNILHKNFYVINIDEIVTEEEFRKAFVENGMESYGIFNNTGTETDYTFVYPHPTIRIPSSGIYSCHVKYKSGRTRKKYAIQEFHIENSIQMKIVKFDTRVNT